MNIFPKILLKVLKICTEETLDFKRPLLLIFDISNKRRWIWCLLFLSISHRVVALFGSSPLLVDSSVASVCSALKVPYLTSHPVLASAENIQARKFAIHLGPSQNDLIRAVKGTIEALKWSELAFLSHRETGKYENIKLKL